MAVVPAKVHFFELPGEVRNTIYKYIFGDLAVHTCSPDFIRDARRYTNTRWTTSLFSVNRQVRQEALSAFSDNLTIYSRWEEMHVIVKDLPRFVLSNASRAFVFYLSENTIGLTPGSRFELYSAVLPKLQRLELLFDQPLLAYDNAREISSIDGLVHFLRGGTDDVILSQLDEDFMEASRAQGLIEDNVSLLWAIEPVCDMKRLCFKHLYRLEFETKAPEVVARKINISQSRSYAFGTWVPADQVVLLVDEVSYPVVWSVEYGMGRVLAKDNGVIEQVEGELQDQARLARALEKGFPCTRFHEPVIEQQGIDFTSST